MTDESTAATEASSSLLSDEEDPGAELGEDELADETPTSHVDASRIEEIVADLDKKLSKWSVAKVHIPVGTLRWKPHLVKDDAVLHVHLSPDVPGYIARRLRAAAADYRVVLALEMESLYDEDTRHLLAELDADVILLGDEPTDPKPIYYLAAIADREVPVNVQTRRELATASWARHSEGSNYRKGRRFEGLLAFLLGQVRGFRVKERNFRAETDEIDIVVQIVEIDAARCWYQPGVPFIFVEAKNWAVTVGSHVVSLLIRKLDTRHGVGRIGMLFSSSAVSPEARMEVIKEAKSANTVVIFERVDIQAWIDADEPDDYLEDFIRNAMLN